VLLKLYSHRNLFHLRTVYRCQLVQRADRWKSDCEEVEMILEIVNDENTPEHEKCMLNFTCSNL